MTGTKYPEQIVLVSGHIDSWDVGQGAMDDGAGAFIAWRSLSVLRALGFKPQRTIRSVLWTGEEMGLLGARQYVQQHYDEMTNIVIAMESDIGTFRPQGITFSGTNLTAQCVMQSIVQLMKSPPSMNATQLWLNNEGSDTFEFYNQGVPISSLSTENERYFWYHHTDADMIDVENSAYLDQCLALWTSVVYTLAALDQPLPR